ncbi:DUF2812 domain-containing protein [Terribacillus saccharophilus]|uniref:DUF2812 domain-containing protein n=1 Tax=Terribacillus saccharophilus TaxID=361277 RepID=UPI003982D3F1
MSKYVMSGGLAFAEEKDMKKLRKYSLKGWHVSSFKFMGYTLEKGPSADYVYSIDYRSLEEGEAEEYFDYFASSNWTHIASEGYIHLFRAEPGTKPIYSDRESVAEKHQNSLHSMEWLAYSLICISLLTWLVALNSSGSLSVIMMVIAIAFTMLAIPGAMTVGATYTNKWEAGGKQYLAKIIRTLAVLALISIPVIIFFVADDLGRTARFLLSMLIGGIALPTAIFVVMSVYTKLRRIVS